MILLYMRTGCVEVSGAIANGHHVERRTSRQDPRGLGRDIDNFEAQMHLRKQGKIEDRVFAETRLRRGTYGQRYDNGHRHDGIQTQELHSPMRR